LESGWYLLYFYTLIGTINFYLKKYTHIHIYCNIMKEQIIT